MVNCAGRRGVGGGAGRRCHGDGGGGTRCRGDGVSEEQAGASPWGCAPPHPRPRPWGDPRHPQAPPPAGRPARPAPRGTVTGGGGLDPPTLPPRGHGGCQQPPPPPTAPSRGGQRGQTAPSLAGGGGQRGLRVCGEGGPKPPSMAVAPAAFPGSSLVSLQQQERAGRGGRRGTQLLRHRSPRAGESPQSRGVCRSRVFVPCSELGPARGTHRPRRSSRARRGQDGWHTVRQRSTRWACGGPGGLAAPAVPANQPFSMTDYLDVTGLSP